MAAAKKISVLIVEPSPMVAEGICSILSGSEEFEVCCVLPDLHHIGEKAVVFRPSIFLINPGSVDYTKKSSLRNTYPVLADGHCVAILIDHFGDELLKQFDGTVSRYDEPGAVIRKLRAVMSNPERQEEPASDDLSDREKEILVAVARGRTNKEIADMHNISVHTVISHRKNITRKTGIRTISGLTVYALLNSLIDMSEVD